MEMYYSACPRNCYSTCSLKVFVDKGRICRIEANPENKATPKGVCLRGLSYIERVYSKERILTPMRRKEDGSGFIRICWDEALHSIVEKLKYFRESYGPQSVFYYYGSGTKGLLNSVGASFWDLYGGYTTTYGDLCWPAGLEATRLTLGDNKHNVPWDIENARLIVAWGKNVAETNVQQMRSIDRAMEKGAKLIVIDPRRTPTADRAELLVQPRPGTDGALALGIAKLLINNNAIDTEYINKNVLGYEEFKKMVLAIPLEDVANATDIPVIYIHRLAEEFAIGKPVSLCPGFGMQRYTNSGQAMRAMIALLAITGNLGISGAGWWYANLQSSIFNKIKDPFSFYPPEKSDGRVRISISTARLGQDMLIQTDPPLKMIWVERGNPVTQNPETHTVLKAFRQLDFRVVVEQFLTDTAREANIILPAKTMFEQSDIIDAYWHPYIQLKQKIIEPLGEVKPESEIYWLLAQGLGFPLAKMSGKIPGPSDQEVEAFLEEKLIPFPSLSLQRLKRGPVLAPGTQEVAFSDDQFYTPSGKIELFSKEAEERWGLDPLPNFQKSEESLAQITPESRQYPLQFLTPNTKNRTHSQFNNLKLIRQFSIKPFALMNLEDALARGIKSGDTIRIFNKRGQLELETQIDFSFKGGNKAKQVFNLLTDPVVP